jgi:hypothetical protein
MAPLECRPSRLKIVGLLVLTCLMVGMSLFCTTLDGIVANVVGWLGAAFFGLGFVALPRAFFRTRDPVVIVGPDGIDDRQFGVGFIPWSDVTALTIHSIHGTKFLSVYVENSESYLSRVSATRRLGAKANESLGYAPITLSFVGLTPGFEEVCYYIQQLGFTLSKSETAV